MKRYLVFNIIAVSLISIGLGLLGYFCFSSSYLRLAESCADLWQSLRYYFCGIFSSIRGIVPTINNFSNAIEWEVSLSPDWEGFTVQAGDYFALLFNGENFSAYGKYLGQLLFKISKVLAFVLPIILVFILSMKMLYRNGNNNYGKDTIPLKTFKWCATHTYTPIKKVLGTFTCFIREHKYIWICWLVVLAFHLNLVPIVISFFAYLLYLFMSFDFGSIYIQIRKLFIDLQVPFRTIPWWIWLIACWLIFDRFRRRIALSKLRRYENRNCGFINNLPIVSLTCGSMGKKKTTIITDMALSQEVMFREKAFELIRHNDMKFPFFPWIKFEMELKRCMEYGTVYNLATVKAWVKKKRDRYLLNGDDEKRLYGYDSRRYGMTYYDGLKREDLFDVLSTYAQLYFIYIIESSLIVSNYSIREDNVLIDQGNFPMWAMDFFSQEEVEGRHSHILDFDTLRLGKKVIENNPNIGSFEFGVLVISETGKERGNNLELKDVKKKQDETNQKNDLFNSWLKMCRHSATVDNFPFIKVFCDEQRPESWGADARDLSDVIRIVGAGKRKLALPFYIYEEMLTDILFSRFIGLYYDFRFKRGDNTLLVYLLKSITGWLYRRNVRIYNQYGYSISYLEKEEGTLEGKSQRDKYYILHKKIYSRRFMTDCFSDYFNELARKTKVGINDYLEYAEERASVEELRKQNSYFMNSLYNNANSD